MVKRYFAALAMESDSGQFVRHEDYDRIFNMLREANDQLRSAYQIASRSGEKTNWDSFKKTTEEILKRQHKEINPAQSGEGE